MRFLYQKRLLPGVLNCAVVIAVLFPLFFLSCASSSKKDDYAVSMDPVAAGVVDGGIAAYFPARVKRIPLTVMYDPRVNMVYLEFRYQTVTYRQYWDEPNRVRFISAVERYRSDYDARNLPERKVRRSRRAYGVLKSRTEWGTFKILINSYSKPQVYLGYAFRDNNPYFLITQRPAKNEAPSAANDQNSLQIELYFTRAMAEDLAGLFRQDYLLSLLPDRVRTRADTVIPGTDNLAPDDYSASPQPLDPPPSEPPSEPPSGSAAEPPPPSGPVTETPLPTLD